MGDLGTPRAVQGGSGTLRVAHVITDLQVGGEATILSWLLPALSDHGIASTVVALTANAHDRAEHETMLMGQLRRAGIPVVSLGARILSMPRAAVRLVQELRRFAPAVVHTYLYHAGIISRPLGRLFTRSLVVSSVVGADLLRGTAASAAERASLRLACKVVVNARTLADKLRTDASLRSRVVLQYNGVDLDRIARAPRALSPVTPGRGPVLATIGRLHYEKGPDIALEVLAEVRRSQPDARLLLVGGGPMEGELRAAAPRRGVAQATTFLGPVSQDEVFGLMKTVDVVLVPSRSEGLPAVVLEAFAARVPVVATAVGSVPEVVVHGTTGLLASGPDSDVLAAHCLDVLRDHARRDRLVRNAFDLVQRFPASDLVAARAGFYWDLVKGRDATSP